MTATEILRRREEAQSLPLTLVPFQTVPWFPATSAFVSGLSLLDGPWNSQWMARLGIVEVQDYGRVVRTDDRGASYLAHVYLITTIFRDGHNSGLQVNDLAIDAGLVDVQSDPIAFVRAEIAKHMEPMLGAPAAVERLKGELDHAPLKLQALEEATGLQEEEQDGDA